MGQDWMQQKKRDGYYRMAKRSGYRARSAYKLREMNRRFGLIRKGWRVLDIGAAPGGWSQVARELVGGDGTVVGVDLQRIEPVEGVVFVQGDITSPAVMDQVLSLVGQADCVISDISPELSGNYSMDQARSAYLSGIALDVAVRALRPGGNFVTKVFEGEDLEELTGRVRGSFRGLKRFHPKASRSASSELYVIGKGYHGPAVNGPGRD